MDTRKLFTALTERKPLYWEELSPVEQFTDEQYLALRELPVVYIYSNEPPGAYSVFEEELPREYLVVRQVSEGDELYYVNTEGYDYARYAFRLDDMWKLLLG